MPKVIAKTLIVLFILTVTIAKGITIYRGTLYTVCSIPLLIGLIIAVLSLTWKYSYRPRENHLGVLYRFDRFHKLVDPDEWVFLIPYFDKILRETNLYMRTTEVILKRVELADGLVVDIKLKVFFKVDLRSARGDNLIQILKFEGPEWSEMIKTSLEDIVRNQVFLKVLYSEVISLRKSREIKRLISEEISQRMKGFGIAINQDHGVMLVDIQPNKVYFDAVQKQKAAMPMGEAAVERLRPILKALKQIRIEDTQAILLLEIASKIVEVNNLPDIVLSSPEDSLLLAQTIKNKRNGISSNHHITNLLPKDYLRMGNT